MQPRAFSQRQYGSPLQSLPTRNAQAQDTLSPLMLFYFISREIEPYMSEQVIRSNTIVSVEADVPDCAFYRISGRGKRNVFVAYRISSLVLLASTLLKSEVRAIGNF
ncbi:hypothetical protein [Pseudopontixanthobacter vadosimaris]|uniref:hypothetical protein n=1 Tax=Pseudopontixanthobacter vadosimaris TaxID=2726450 RepID=UPI001474DEF7|nr:hypothetical protein [Pseudopontixanthobacter vadosimaris]